MKDLTKLARFEKLDGLNVHCSYDRLEKSIVLSDKVDQNNLPMEASRNKRGLEKAWGAVASVWREDMKMREVSQILTLAGIKMHYWCSMD